MGFSSVSFLILFMFFLGKNKWSRSMQHLSHNEIWRLFFSDNNAINTATARRHKILSGYYRHSQHTAIPRITVQQLSFRLLQKCLLLNGLGSTLCIHHATLSHSPTDEKGGRRLPQNAVCQRICACSATVRHNAPPPKRPCRNAQSARA